MSVQGPNDPTKPKPGEKKQLINWYQEDQANKLTGFKAVIHAIWPVKYRKRKTADTGELFIKTTLRNLILYVVYLAVVCIIVYGEVGLINFYFSSGMLSLFIDTSWDSLNTDKTFRNGFVDTEEFWTYLLATDNTSDSSYGYSPFLNGLYFDTWYDLNATSSDNLGYIFYQNKILGPARIMQVRVNDDSCTLSSAGNKLIGNCIGTYSDSIMSRDTFGYGLDSACTTSDSTYNAWRWASDPQNAGSYRGLTGNFPGSGFQQSLSNTDRWSTVDILQKLKDNLWIDRFTRVVYIDFTVYNGNVNLFNQMRLILEFPPSGGIYQAWTVRTAKLLRYVSTFDYVVLAMECLFILFTVYYTMEEIVDICFSRCAYFKDPYNMLDWMILALSYTTIGLSLYRTIAVEMLLDKLLADQSKFANFDTLTFCQELFNQFSAIVVFFAWVKVFKYISLNKTLDQLNTTLKKSVRDIIYFIIIFMIVFVAFGALGYLLFGELDPDYQTFPKTMFTLFRTLLGDFDFVTLRTYFPITGPMYFFSFVFIGFFVLLNMFMAIINDSYTQVKEEMARSQPEFMLSDYLKLNYGKVVNKMNLRRNRILDIEEILKSDEVANSSDLDYSLWRKKLRLKGYAEQESYSLFARYDRDCTGKLTGLEKLRLIRDIARAKKNVSEEFKNFKEKRETKSKKDAFEVGDDQMEDDDDGPRQMTRDDFDYAVSRIDRMELSVASIINKIDRLFAHLENMEIDKMKKRQEIASKLKQ